MARIASFHKVAKDRTGLHEPTEAQYLAFDTAAGRILQIDTIGSRQRKEVGKMSQSIQLDRQTAGELLAILRETFEL